MPRHPFRTRMGLYIGKNELSTGLFNGTNTTGPVRHRSPFVAMPWAFRP